MSDTSDMPGMFFWITIVTVILLNSKMIFTQIFRSFFLINQFLFSVAGGIYQNSVYGMAAKLPIKYTGAVVLGSNISGTFTAIMSLLSRYFSESVRTAAIYYFITAMFVLLICFDTYFALPLNVS